MTRLILLFLLWVGITAGTVMDLEKRIIGGHPCKRPYHVKLRGVTPDGSYNLCGGSLISDRWILTAAHCLQPHSTMFADVVVDPAGTTREIKITAEPVIYADKDANNNTRPHDIMLLQLPDPTNNQPIALPHCENHLKIPLSKVQIAGHAATTGGANDERKPGSSSTLHCADMEVVDCKNLNETLQQDFKKIYQVKVYQHWFCGQSPGIDICYGDSGGGVVFEDKIYGVISFLGDPMYVCRKAAAFMDLCNPEYVAWINKTIAEQKKGL